MEALEKAKSDLMETDKKQAKQAQTLTALRLGPQRVRLVDREHAHRENIRNIQLSTNRSAIMHIVETEEERDARIAMLEEHTHRAAMAAQRQNLTPKPPVEAEPAKKLPLRVPEWMHDRMADPKAARPTTAPHAARMCYSSPRAEGMTPRPPSSARPRPRPPNSTRASRPPTAASARPGSAVALPERPASDLEVVTGAALRRQLYVQTPTARDVIDGAAVEALRPCVDRMASQVTSEAVGGSGAKAALALAQRVCMEPPSRTPKVEKLDRGSASVFYNPRVHPEPDNSTARVAAVWNDSSLNASKAKEQKANLRTWHAHRHAWKRSSGRGRRCSSLRRSARTRSPAGSCAISSRSLHGCYWQREDDAALAMQAAWRSFVLQRKQRRQLDITLRLSGIVKDTSSTVEGTVSVAAGEAAQAALRRGDPARLVPQADGTDRGEAGGARGGAREEEAQGAPADVRMGRARGGGERDLLYRHGERDDVGPNRVDEADREEGARGGKARSSAGGRRRRRAAIAHGFSGLTACGVMISIS